MNKSFYGSLAVSNIKKNAKGYVPYMLTCTFSVMFFYIMLNLAKDPGVKEMIGGEILQSMLNFGSGVFGFFSAIFLFYTNSFLVKQRKKELALYNILGMAKRHIGKMLFCETLLTAAASLAAGLLGGAVLGKLAFLALWKVLDIEIPLRYHLSGEAAAITCILFGVIFLAVLLCNLGRVTVSNPMQLLGGSREGEREPKARWIPAAAGLVMTGIGYYLAITVESPLQALITFFVAVLLVIAGTYLLFITGSIALLKLLKKNKRFYYKTRNFTAVSGMLYRMKRNAAGLASICILSTMVLVTVSTTVSMQVGLGNVIDENYKDDILLRQMNTTEAEERNTIDGTERVLAKHRIDIESEISYPYLEYTAELKGSRAVFAGYSTWTDSMATLYFIPIEGSRMGEQVGSVKKNEVIISGRNPFPQDTLRIGNKEFKVKEKDGSFMTSPHAGIMTDYYFVLVSDRQVMEEIRNQDKDKMTQGFYMGINIPEAQEAAAEPALIECSEIEGTSLMQKSVQRQGVYALYGGLFFIGIFLGLLFLMATVLIIYYKQISEGYEDRQRYQIMQKVGMSLDEVKKSIRSQILIVFFLPLAVAVVHVAGAFNMMSKLLIAMSIPNVSLFIVCTLVTILIFAAIYILVYSLTAREYYKLVK